MKTIKYFIFATIFFITACSPKKDVALSTGEIISSKDIVAKMGPSYTGDEYYAVVDSKWLSSFYEEFRSEIFKKGVVNWDERFDCNHFAAYYVSLAQTKFYLMMWGSSSRANTLAMGTYWYIPSMGKGHAIVAIFTEKGLIFIDPQSGREVKLTETQKASAYLKVF